jgi:hypothetical protein
MGNFVNTCVILIFMAMLGQTGDSLDPVASRNIIILQVGGGGVGGEGGVGARVQAGGLGAGGL